MDCLVLIDLENKTAHAGTDMAYIASILKVDPTTVKRRLPYWTNGSYILSKAEYVKSNRGGPGNKNIGK